ncbi:MAG: bifunctional (p)ppGpp synthetase/guanosine-3',5'-bis(diphosphate) 3'-pyrophosphohydrolase [Deltaproteobacteria bacterium]|nr:bifunctional (p)ppGpp synthetase/guanosine-3',5'-bis(diphosphate) 3'-pyrophosphohydrolase [Deltaproteobacteria bacterium]MBW2016058.1 bifunctional (p)ppGpp synthetase/guanosine-3',5'-bis(diphosphate) 3'-pyrophosphohydrolase [Deltaproteobacteria bacterium]MBW2129787.1 bifunctional (p)ppGpp synthetase/guanosine-3',5'-bis(diphosphate) 3'-pyrophosphohydrolase [Deltaproteobacteria bacterium]MBW2303459.1 bifunctional (p)ppGpp synthetase/guanosine-3',5'-bis(diphosphate) 3'-pyrophosphohydrolase [Delt
MIRLNDITGQLLSYNPNAEISLVEKAYVYSAKVHQGQIRLSGEPYLSHPLEVAYILTQMKMDVTSVAAGLLHDTIEDTDAELSEIERLFGTETAKIVDGVTKIGQMQFTTREERQAENMRKMILAMATDIRVIIVKLADRLHNMQTLGFQPPEKQVLIARETLDIYAPLAGRMGIYWLKSSLEDLCLFYLEPAIYEMIKTELAMRRGAREKFIEEVKALLSRKLEEANIKATIKGRHKHFYSIYRKMRDQNLNVNQVHDVVAFRVIVNSLRECYEILGLIHSMWKPVAGRFKDYISMPKANMYQSLHTTVIGPLGQRMEIQIRTWEMDRVAEEGIAAHWKYKEGLSSSREDERQFAWLRQLLEWQKSLKDPREFMESVRMDLFPDEVYVFTPRGEVKAFPRGATPVDFAYSIHSEVGDKCAGARVNGRMVPLRYQLKNGDMVEIITSAKAHPSKDWLDFVKTSRAKTKIRHWIRGQETDQSITLGREILEKALEQNHINLPNLQKSEPLAALAREFSFHTVQDLLANIGYGKVSVRQVIGRLKPKLGIEEEKVHGIVSKMVSRIKRKKSTRRIKVKGVDHMMVRFANCCNPLPGEPVIGFITRGRGVTIHKHDCRHIKEANPERLVDVVWESSAEEVHAVKLKVTTLEGKGVLAEVSAAIAQKDGNILQADVKTTVDHKGISVFTVEITDYRHLQEIINALKRVKNVLLVERL